MKRIINYLFVLVLGSALLTSCYDEPDFIKDNTTPTGKGSVPVSGNDLIDLANGRIALSTSATAPNSYAAGEKISFELGFFSDSPIKEINLYETIGTGARTKVQTYPYKPAFSQTDRTDTLIVNYTVPQVPSKSVIKLETEILNENGLNLIRTFYVQVGMAQPTISVKSILNVPFNGVTAEGDSVVFNVAINENTAELYRPVDSVRIYYTIEGEAERFLRREAVTGTGAISRNFGVKVPAGSVGKSITYRFEVVSRRPKLTASASAAPIQVTAPSALTGPVTGMVELNAASPDMAAYDLLAQTNVAATAPDATKDLVVTSVTASAFSLASKNDTRFVKTTAGVFNAATHNSISYQYLRGSATASATISNAAVGDVYIAKLRGQNRFAIFTVTGITKNAGTGAPATLTFSVKYL
ncbi:hypothetical protein TH61_13840 [Rufibacter sp. DG15C]|uniref:hypothetical protein n=1 Tax=Rufibacter sp. DG15C TaxID=1379909 RepID=UPI00078B858A|nr:hypothetical protein [Rufibacter sp. DG15C]AMM52050.1 hypothetical protein TH61_13840 [Rufibacter sp. DG15C]